MEWGHTVAGVVIHGWMHDIEVATAKEKVKNHAVQPTLVRDGCNLADFKVSLSLLYFLHRNLPSWYKKECDMMYQVRDNARYSGFPIFFLRIPLKNNQELHRQKRAPCYHCIGSRYKY
jgi:hypothetical protein